MSLLPATEDEIMPRDYLDNSSSWLPNQQKRVLSLLSTFGMNENSENNSETVLMEGAYPYPQTKLVPFGNGKLLALFVGDPGEDKRDDLNRAQLFYTIHDGNTWTTSVAVDTDETWDEAPDAFVIDDKILVTWADAERSFTSDDTPVTTLSAMNISARWFDIADEEFKEDEFAITKYTEAYDEKEGKILPFDQFADLNPKISYDPATKRLMVYYKR